MVTLEASKLFAQLNAKEIASLQAVASEKSFEAGSEIFKEGDPGDGVYIVKTGLVEISVPLGKSARHVFSKVTPGDFFGEMAVLESKPRSASAVARENTTVYFVPREALLNLVENSPALALTLLREISHRLREFNQQHLREVVQAERLAVVGRFARSIVHDLKNPLNIIGLTAEIVGMPRVSAEQRQTAVANINQQVERISDMVGEILDFTQGTRPDLVLPQVDFRGFVEQVVAELRPDLEVKSVSIELESPPPSLPLLMNPKRLRRVFYNLVHNAKDAMPEGGKILIRFAATPKEIITEVEDTGPGVAPELLEHLFEPFATFGKQHGTGLGLSICKRVLEDHRGWISSRNKPGHGAIFAFGLPRPQ